MVTNKLFAIGIPTVNRADLLNPTLEKYTEQFPNTRIYIVDNGKQDIVAQKNTIVLRNRENKGCVKSWNQICQANYHEVAAIFFLNDDVRVCITEEQVKAQILRLNKEWLINSTKQWSSFILPDSTAYHIGLFDECFHSYYADNDYERRMRLSGKEIYNFSFLDPCEYIQSGSTQKDPMLNLIYEPDRQAYIKKWGGEPGKETFEIPYNE